MKTLALILVFLSSYVFSQTNLKQTESGLQYEILKKGNGIKPETADKVYVHYVGKLMNDTIFDSSYKRGAPFSFNLGEGRVIRGWDEGIALLNEGDSAILIIPPQLGYGNTQVGNIPPNSTLKFYVKLVKVEKAPQVKPYNIEGKEKEVTESGLTIIHVEKNKENKIYPQAGDNVEVHYTGYLEDGKIFDSSVRRGEPIIFTIGKGQVIKGWDEGISRLTVGEKARLIIPYNLAYGENGYPPVIPPKANLTFDVELLNIYKPATPIPFDTKGKDTITTTSGLKYIVINKVDKNAVKAEKGKTVKVHYTGYFKDGKIFDSSVQRGQPFSFKLGEGRVIKGWEEGIALMKVGEKYRFIIPYNLAYGETGAGPIPPKTDLIFDVELLDVN